MRVFWQGRCRLWRFVCDGLREYNRDLRWNHVFSNTLFTNFTLIYSDFDYHLGMPSGAMSFDWTSNIIDKSFKNDYLWYITPSNTLNFGLQLTHHTFKPGNIESGEGSFFDDFNMAKQYALEGNLFAENEHKVNQKLSLQYGLRYSSFSNIGGNLYSLNNSYNVTDTTKYKRWNEFNTYSGLEPRIGVRYILLRNSSIKIGYNRMYQYIHLATNSTTPTPIDIYFPSNPNIKPQKADQVAVGYFHNFADNMYETSVEVYYKKCTMP
ncbi:MAG: TonB-dependent receptor [Bacteroidales bacterium]|nr:TonB-dependent receptor [Bacteroidales bacterium]